MCVFVFVRRIDKMSASKFFQEVLGSYFAVANHIVK